MSTRIEGNMTPVKPQSMENHKSILGYAAGVGSSLAVHPEFWHMVFGVALLIFCAAIRYWFLCKVLEVTHTAPPE